MTTLKIHRPADGTLIEEIVAHDAAHVDAVAQRLRTAQVEWARIGAKGRAVWIKRYRKWLFDNATRLIEIAMEEGGRVRNEPTLETTLIPEIIDYYLRVTPALLEPRPVRGSSPLTFGKRYTVHRSAFPLVGVIGAWNFPLLLTLGDAIPALLAGSAVALKPSEVNPRVVIEAVRGWREDIGAPPVLDVLIGGGEVGSALVDAADYIQFTGSVATGRRVAVRAAENLIPVSLELGGKDPLIVLAGADIARAANCAVYGGFANNGQVCMGFERVYVHESAYDEFVDRVVTKVRQLRSGVDDHSDVGALIHPPQLQIVDRQVRDAVDKGARILTGGNRIDRPGNWFEPTVLVDVDHSMAVMREETFGPVLPIVRVADADEAIHLANDSEFGLSASVFAATVAEGKRVADRLDTGAVSIDDFVANMVCADVPQGGWKKSGVGSRLSETGLLKFTHTKVVAANWIPTLDNDVFWFPYTPARRAVFGAAARLIQGRGSGRFGL
ncbi:aldehyde dehydrogenase family protein [Nocardia sp. NPDC051833]|uniref:aldehyde dehydrogenase family protein n=1 Tax=Nocardia sp. NPDC051833 TaxID=3155674 RepID=UPI003432DDCA